MESLGLEEIGRVLAELAQLGSMHLIITGGEPLVRKDIFEILEEARNLGFGITLYSNGHAITKPVAHRLSGLVGSVELSILAGSAEQHDRLSKVRGSYERTWSAVQSLIDEGVHVCIKTPVLRPALPTLDLIERKAITLGIVWTADPEISISYAGSGYPLEYRLTEAEMKDFYSRFPQFSKFAGFNLDPGSKEGMCLAGRNYAFIDAEGNVYPCLNFKAGSDRARANGMPSAWLGNVNSSSFADLWHSEESVLTEIRSASRSDFPACAHCAQDGGCAPCMALNMEESGNLWRRSSKLCGMGAAMRPEAERRMLPLVVVRN